MRSLWIAVSLIVTPYVSNACTCALESVEAEFERSSAVFEATVASIDPENELVRMRISSVWKTDGADLTLLANAPKTDPCAYPFRKDKSYIVFAQRYRSFWSFLPWVKNELSASVCTLTTPSLVPEEWKGSEGYERKLSVIRAFLEQTK